MPHKWTEEELSYLKEIAPGRSYKEIRDLFNQRFEADLSQSAINGALKRKHIANGRDTRFQNGQESWCKGVPRASWMTPEQLEHVRANQFKPGDNRRYRDAKPGTERVTKDGYIEVRMEGPVRSYQYGKRKATHCWRFKHVLIWEEANGPVPKGHKILFLDGNTQNFSIDNLVCISRAELLMLNRQGLRFKDHPDLTRIGLDIVKLKNTIKEGNKDAKQRRTRRPS